MLLTHTAVTIRLATGVRILKGPLSPDLLSKLRAQTSYHAPGEGLAEQLLHRAMSNGYQHLGAYVLVVDNTDRLLGAVSYVPGEDQLTIDYIGVRSEAQSQGIGSALIQAVQQIATEKGIPVTTDPSSKLAPLALKHGFAFNTPFKKQPKSWEMTWHPPGTGPEVDDHGPAKVQHPKDNEWLEIPRRFIRQ